MTTTTRAMTATTRRRPAFLPRVLAAAALALAHAHAVAAPPIEPARLENLTAALEAARVEQHIPGLAIVVVANDEIIYAEGFGHAEVATQTPVTPETIFAVGSTTKAFTSAVIAMLVDEGKMAWDDPVTKYLPGFTPVILAPESDADADGEGGGEPAAPPDTVLTVRDLLSHRSGFTRSDMTWVSGLATRAEILAAAATAEAWAPFRKQFLYNNVMYMAAGMSAGVAAGSDWETLMRTRLFAPLGMEDASLTHAEAQADERLATGYRRKDDAFEALPMRNLDMIGPAGSINANALDMAEWVRLQLGRGAYSGEQLISEAALTETWTPQVTIAGDISYGLGWMLHDWDGRHLVEHGGNIDGFAAQVAFLPDDNIGFVLLMNTGFAPLQAGSIGIVFETLLGTTPGADTPAAPPEVAALADYTGVYIANYAQFAGEKFTVSVGDDGRLALDIPSQRVYTLGVPGEGGRRPFVGVPGLAADFEVDEEGTPVVLRLYQGGLMFEIPREGYEYPVEIPLADLAKYTGKYRFDEMDADLTVLVRNNHLAVDVPEQMVYELRPPDADERWQFRSNDVMTIAVSFTRDAAGAVESMTMHQGGKDFVLSRVAADAAAADLPTIAEVVALARLAERQRALDDASLVELAGTVRFAQSGISGANSIIFDGGSRFSNLVDLGSFGAMRSVLDGDTAIRDISFSPFETLSGQQLEEARLEHPALFLGDWTAFFGEVRVTGLGEVDGRPVIEIEGVRGEAPATTLFIDAETGDVLRVDSVSVLAELNNAKMPFRSHYRGWREEAGLRVPGEMSTENEMIGRIVVTIDSVTANADPDPARFSTDPRKP